MLITLLILQTLTLLALLALLLRKPEAAAGNDDPRLAQLLSADLPKQMTVLDTRFDGLDSHLRGQMAELRSEAASSSTTLRTEIVGSRDEMKRFDPDRCGPGSAAQPTGQG